MCCVLACLPGCFVACLRAFVACLFVLLVCFYVGLFVRLRACLPDCLFGLFVLFCFVFGLLDCLPVC